MHKALGTWVPYVQTTSGVTSAQLVVEVVYGLCTKSWLGLTKQDHLDNILDHPHQDQRLTLPKVVDVVVVVATKKTLAPRPDAYERRSVIPASPSSSSFKAEVV